MWRSITSRNWLKSSIFPLFALIQYLEWNVVMWETTKHNKTHSNHAWISLANTQQGMDVGQPWWPLTCLIHFWDDNMCWATLLWGFRRYSHVSDISFIYLCKYIPPGLSQNSQDNWNKNHVDVTDKSKPLSGLRIHVQSIHAYMPLSDDMK